MSRLTRNSNSPQSQRVLAKRASTTSALVLAAVIAVTSAPALASGGSGGGGGGGFGGNSGPQRDAVDPVAAYRAGLKAYKSGDYKKSAREFRRVLTVDRRNPEANYFTGMSYIGLDKPKRAVKYFRTAVKSRPSFIEANEQYALTLVRLEKFDDAQKRLVAMEELAEKNPSGRLQTSIDRVRSAIETGETPNQLNLALVPTENIDIAHLLYADAVKLINTHQYEAAIAELYKTQYQVGLHADIQNYLGYTHRKLGKYAQAKTYYNRALKLNPEHRGAREYLGELYIEIGDMKNARKQLAKLDQICGFGCAEREELARLVHAETVQVALISE